MTVRVRGGRFMLDLRHQHPDGRNERIRLAVPNHMQTRRGAEAFERQVLVELRAGTFGRREEPSPPPTHHSHIPTIAAYAPTYLREQAIAGGLKPSTVASKRMLLANWILPKVGTRPVDAVRTADFTALRTAMMEAGRTGKTTNNALVVLSSLVRYWHEQHDRTPPAFRVGLVKVERHRKAAFYTDDEVDKLVAAAHALGRDACVLVLLGLDAGLRMSEIRALRWSDLLLGARPTVTVSRTREGDVEHSPKGWRSRTIPLTERLARALARLPRTLRDDHILLDRAGEQPLTRRMVTRRFESVQRAAGLPVVGRFHATRHTFCTRLAARGVPVRTIQELAGHADLATSQRYMHAAPGLTDAAIRSLEGPDRGHSLGTRSEARSKTAS